LNINFKNSNEVVDNYYPHCESLVHEAFYSEESKHKLFGVYAFDHNVRSSSNNIKSSSSSNTDKSIDDTNVLEPVGIVHNDYTIQSAPNRLKLLGQKPTSNNDVLYSKFQKNNITSLVDPAVIEDILNGKKQFAFMNVWRNISPHSPIKQLPLACCDATSCENVDDFITYQIHYADRIGENYFLKKNDCHEWYYYPDMTFQEALLIKQWDSLGDFSVNGSRNGGACDEGGKFKSTFSIHSAFRDWTSPDDAPPRESIEVRCLVIYQK